MSKRKKEYLTVNQELKKKKWKILSLILHIAQEIRRNYIIFHNLEPPWCKCFFIDTFSKDDKGFDFGLWSLCLLRRMSIMLRASSEWLVSQVVQGKKWTQRLSENISVALCKCDNALKLKKWSYFSGKLKQWIFVIEYSGSVQEFLFSY